MKTPKVFVNQQFQQEMANHTNSGYSIASLDYHSHKSNKKHSSKTKAWKNNTVFCQKRMENGSSFVLEGHPRLFTSVIITGGMSI